MPLCPSCNNDKPEKSFKLRGLYRSRTCRRCERKKYGPSPGDAKRDARNKTLFRWRLLGIQMTLEKFDQLLIEQSGRCAICNRPLTGPNEPAVDHNHENGEPRGLLCFLCNRGLGCFRDKIGLLQEAADYLLSFKR